MKASINPGVLLLLTLPCLFSSCQGCKEVDEHCDGTDAIVRPLTVPASDATPPATTLGISGGITESLSSNDATGKTFTLNGNEHLVFTANGSDPESGILTTQIWYTETKWKKLATGGEIQYGPGAVGAPAAENADGAASKMPGETACEARNTTLNLDIAQLRGTFDRYRLEISARSINAFGQETWTKFAVLNWN